jgi:ribosomal protein S18 acetylase RimI-like enzyme
MCRTWWALSLLILPVVSFNPAMVSLTPAVRAASEKAAPAVYLSLEATPFRQALQPLRLSSTVLTPARGKPVKVSLRPARPSDAVALANLCTDAFYGEHTMADGPIKFVQRSLVLAKVFSQVSRRLSFEGKRECRLLLASDSRGGPVRGCIDLAVHLFDSREQKFELLRDEMPGDAKYCWRPYVASLAVERSYRRKGVARKLLREAEAIARSWGYRELLLEVSAQNDAAIQFYTRAGYKVLRTDISGTGAEEVNTEGLLWIFSSVPKYVLRKGLYFPLPPPTTGRDD